MIRRFSAQRLPDFVGFATLSLIVVALFAPMLTQMLWGRGFDYPLHLEFVKAYREASGELPPYPLFHLSVLAVLPLLPPLPFLETYKQAGLIVGMGLYLLAAAVLYWCYVRPGLGARSTYRRAALALTATLLLMLLAPVNILSWREGHLYWGYFLPNIHMNPTLAALKPFALLLFIYVVGAFSERRHFATWAAVGIAALLTVLATLAKPNYTLIMLPVLVVAGIYQTYRGRAVNRRLLVLGLIVPAVLLLAWQYVALNQSAFAGGAMLLRPFQMLTERGIHNLPLKLLLSVAFPLAVYLAYWRESRADTALNLAWLIFLVGAASSYAFVEQDRVGDGNFVWSGQIAVTVLFAAAMRFLLRAVGVERGRFTRAGIVCLVALALHGLGGVFWYYADMVSPGFVWY